MFKRFLLIIIFLQSLNAFAQSSFFSDNSFNEIVRENIDSIYNFRFDSTDKIQDQLELHYQNHPLSDLYSSMELYWKYFPITPENSNHEIYIGKINNAIKKVDSLLKEDKNNSEAIFFNLMSRMLILRYYSDNNLSSMVIPHLRPAYKMVKKGFTLKDSLNDFYFSTGVYNYSREYYPEAYPVYKPIAFFFPDGDIEIGLKQLEYNSREGIYLKAESLFYLVYINLYFEKNYKQALKYAKQLTNNFPQNLFYLSYKIRILLVLEKYHKAQLLIPQLRNSSHENDFFKILANIYDAVIIEKKHADPIQAELIYLNVIKDIDKYGEFANSYKAIVYFGLARIYSEKDKELSEECSKKAMELTIFTHINYN